MPALRLVDQQPPDSDPSAFMQAVIAELGAGDVRLPSFPDIAARVQRVLEDGRSTPAQIAKVIGADAALAARILRLASSAFLNPGGKPVSDLQLAVARLGHQLVRCTAVSFAVQQMKLDATDKTLRPQLQEIWRRGTLVAAIAYVIAREKRVAGADEALVSGLMHNIGILYITVRARGRVPPAQNETWAQLVREWHPEIARMILEHWKFPESIVQAVGQQNAWGRETDGSDRLTDALSCAIALVPCVFNRDLLPEIVGTAAPFARLRLGVEECQKLLLATAEQIKALHAALLG